MTVNNEKLNQNIVGFVDYCDYQRVSGWLIDFSDINRHLSLKVLIDDAEVCVGVADEYRQDLASHPKFNGTCHAYNLKIHSNFIDGKEHEIKVIEARTGYVLNKAPFKVVFPKLNNQQKQKINNPSLVIAEEKNAFLFGVPPSIENSAFISTGEAYKLVGLNTGNLAFSYAINQMLGGNLKSINWYAESDRINSLGDTGVLTLSNQLGIHADMGGLVKKFRELQCKLIGIGLGVQANNLLQYDIEIPRGTLDWVKAIQDNSPSSAPNIAMRGEFSWKVLEKYKLAEKAIVLGCPTLFISPDRQLGASIASKFTNIPKRIAVTAGHPNWKHLSKIEASLIEMANSNKGSYICQSHLEMLQLGRNEVHLLSSEQRDFHKNYINPALTDDEFIDWCNFNALSFFSASAWMEYMRRFDFVIGTRIHGVMLALQVGVPALCITHDSRTEELCQTMKVPYVNAKDVIGGIKRDDIQRLFNFDPDEFDKNRQNLAKNYVQFLETNGLQPANYLKLLGGMKSDDSLKNLQENVFVSITNGTSVLKTAKSNPFRTMPKWMQSFNGFAEISHIPKFKFKKEYKFFTIGSCFARNVENYLRNEKCELLSDMPVLSGSFYELSGKGDRTGYQNVYTPGSVLEVVRLIGSKNEYHSIVGENEQYFDLLTSGLIPLPYQSIKAIRRGILDTYSKLSDADVLFITLGYNEAWFYIPHNSFVNVAPSHIKLRKKIDDFNFFSLSFFEAEKILDEAIKLVNTLNPDCKIVLTVSPVPLGATFTESNIVVANQKSKAILLTVATRMAEKHPFVDYFPSYEIIMNSEKRNVFETDGVHIKKEGVEQVMNAFFSSYFS
jgi:hypothetical protein